MGFNLKQVVVAGETASLTDAGKTVKSSDLSKEELEYLLILLKNADLKGHQIEMFYSMIIKLQNQYILVNK
jgi:hypothetical protein